MEPHSIYLRKIWSLRWPRRWPSKAEVLQAIPKVCWKSLWPWGWWTIGKLWVSDLDFSKSAEVECDWWRDCEVAEYNAWMFCFWQGWWAARITSMMESITALRKKSSTWHPSSRHFILGLFGCFFLFFPDDSDQDCLVKQCGCSKLVPPHYALALACRDVLENWEATEDRTIFGSCCGFHSAGTPNKGC